MQNIGKKNNRKLRILFLTAALTFWLSPVSAQETSELAAAAQNPVASMISLPFQNNTFFGIGPDDETANVLNIQPVIPLHFGEWNLINRTILPLIHLPDLTGGIAELPEGEDSGSEFGLGDINHTVFSLPQNPAKLFGVLALRSILIPLRTIVWVVASGALDLPR